MAETTEIDFMFRAIKTPVNIRLDVSPRTEDESNISSVPEGQLEGGDKSRWHNLAMCRQATTEVATENDEEEGYDAIAKKRIRNENPQVTTRRTTYDMERQTVLYAALYNGIKEPFSDTTLSYLQSGTAVPMGGTSDPKMPLAFREVAYDDKQHILWRKYFYGVLINAGSQTYDGKISRPQLQVEEESSPANVIKFSTYYVTGVPGDDDQL